MRTARPLAVWQNILLAIPVGIIGGAVAAIATMGVFVYILEPIERPDFWTFQELSPMAGFGAMIGLITFPIAYATVARTKSLFSVVPAGLVGTVLGAWVGLGMLVALDHWPRIVDAFNGNATLYVLLLAIAAMFGSCAWAAARERRKIAGRP